MPRTTTGIEEVGTTGHYRTTIAIDDAWPRSITVRWDAGAIVAEADYDLTASGASISVEQSVVSGSQA